MKKLGEQWVEVIDGKRHMLKAVANTHNCNGCAYLGDTSICLHSSILECPVYRLDAIIKDLGILNEDGLLPCPFCGEYPVVENAYEGCGYPSPDGYWRVYCSNDNHEISMSSGKCRQESIDAWNRRV